MATFENLTKDRGQLQRQDTVERVAELLRTRILAGEIAPGQRLSEEALGKALEISRNTLREAFRLLGRQRLVEHHFHRGVFVRELAPEDVQDLFETRRALGAWALLNGNPENSEALAGMREALKAAEKAAARSTWDAVGQADLAFHQSLELLAESPRLAAAMELTLTEFRLALAASADAQAMHETSIARNRQLLELIEQGRTDEAYEMLMDQLDTAEAQLLDR